MNERVKQIVTNYKLLLLVLGIIIAVVAINPRTDTHGAFVVSSGAPLRQDIKGQTIVAINNFTIRNLDDYHGALATINPGDTVRITTHKQTYPFLYKTINIYPFLAEERDNRTWIGTSVSKVPTSNLVFGLELSGGTKLVLKPDEELSQVEFENVLSILRERLDLFGVKGAAVSSIIDLTGEHFIQVELAGVTSQEARNLLEKEGKFEAKIRNQTIFTGTDIRDVCVAGVQCTMRLQAKGTTREDMLWEFAFGISITQKAADAFANATSQIETVFESGQEYVNATIDFYIDDELIEDASLRIPASLKGVSITDPVITGGSTVKEDAQSEMRYLQSILQSRKLPVKLNILNVQSVSPTLGKQFVQNIFLIFIVAILAVDVIIAARYKDLKLVAVTIFISASEIFITLGIAALIHWNLDIASIAGIIASVGTGIDDQIVILDEVMNKHSGSQIKRRINKAFFIVIASFAVSIASMLPLLFAGAGLLRGFAVTTIIGLCVGVFVTRPAFAELVRMVEGKE